MTQLPPYPGPDPAAPPPTPYLVPVTPVPYPLPYHQLHRGGSYRWWKTLVGIVAGAVAFVLAQAFVLVPFAFWYGVTGKPLEQAMTDLADSADPTPAFLLYLTLALASLIPTVWLLTYLIFGLKPGWVSSVMPRIRWGYLFACLGLSVLVLVLTLLVSAVLPDQDMGADVGGGLNSFTPELRDYLLIVVLIVPFQAAGEEYFFRGYLTQLLGSQFAHPLVSRMVAVLVPAFVFALAHGAQDAPIFFDRFAFGVVSGVLVIVTGGLEAGIAMHVLNNWLAFGLALAFSDMASALNPTGGSWWSMPVTLTQSLAYLAVAWWLARRMGLRSTADPAVLAASRGLVYRSPSA